MLINGHGIALHQPIGKLTIFLIRGVHQEFSYTCAKKSANSSVELPVGISRLTWCI